MMRFAVFLSFLALALCENLDEKVLYCTDLTVHVLQ